MNLVRVSQNNRNSKPASFAEGVGNAQRRAMWQMEGHCLEQKQMFAEMSTQGNLW